MAKNAAQFLVVFILFFSFDSSAQNIVKNERPSTLRDSIVQAIKRNPKTQSTDQFLESVHYGTLAAKASRLPNGLVYCNAGYSQSSTRFTGGLHSRASGFSRACGLSVSYTIYDGGAAHAAYKAAEASEKATRYSYNTADSLITNTKGGLANDTLTSYINLVLIRDAIKFSEDVLVILRRFEKYSSDANLKSKIVDVETTSQELIDKEHTAREKFRFNVKLDPADQLETMDHTISSLRVPKDAASAEAIALSQGPEVLRRNAEVEMATWSLKSLKATYGPRLSVTADLSRGNYYDRLGPIDSNYTNKSVGLTLTIPLNPSAKYQIKSARKGLQAKESEREAAMASARHAISITYSQLEAAKSSYATLERNYNDQAALVRSYASQIDSGNTAGLDITKMLVAVEALGDRYDKRLMKQMEIVMSLFSINQVTGLLFEEFAPVDSL